MKKAPARPGFFLISKKFKLLKTVDLEPEKMNLILFVFLILFSSSIIASDSEILRDLMGEEVFEKSGLRTLEQDQLDVWKNGSQIIRLFSHRAELRKKSTSPR